MENTAPQPGTFPRARPSSIVALLTGAGFPSALAGYLPSRHWLVDLPACFPVQAGAALLLGAVVLLLARRPWLGLLWLAGFLAAAGTVVPGWLAAPRGNSTGGEPLSVLSLNLERGNEANAALALATIRRAEADVVFLSEVTPGWAGALASDLADYPHRHVTPDPGYFGVAVYSRLPLSSVTTIPLAYEWAPAIRAILATPAGPVGMLGVHTPRPGRGRRCAERDRALAAIPRAIAVLPARRIVLGDFNATPWNDAFRDLLEITQLRNVTGDRFRPTWPTGYPWPFRIPIDHVLASGDVGVEHVSIGESFGSDHLPVAARLRL